MKFLTHILTTYLFLGSLLSHGQDLIRQYNYSTGTFRDVYLSNNQGTVLSPMIVPNPGACFDLWARGIHPDNYYYRLDTKVVGTYLPQASIQITSEDPYPATRTRADRPYDVTMVISGLINDDPSAPLASKRVLYLRHGENYPEGTYRIPMNTSRSVYVLESYDVPNGTHQSTHYNSISPANPTEATGEETYRAYSYPDASIPVASILAQQVIQIWPVANAEVSGVTENERFVVRLPELSIKLTALYPDSLTYVQLYQGPKALGRVGTVLPSTVRDFDADVPQDETILIRDWGEHLQEDGIYTVEVLTVTPFNSGNPERLGAITFEIDREVELRGTVTSSEN